MKNKDLGFPGFTRIMKGRADREAFNFCLEHLLKGVGSVRMWTKIVGERGNKLGDWLSVSDEAWFLLVIENYWEVWKVEVEKEVSGDESIVIPKARWTGKDKNNNRRGKGKKRCVCLLCV